MKFPGTIPSKRRLVFSMLILSLLAVFFGGYYFYFVPSNKQAAHREAFYILNSISKAAIDRNAYTEKLLGNLLKTDGKTLEATEAIQRELAGSKTGAQIVWHKNAVTVKDSSNQTEKNASIQIVRNLRDPNQNKKIPFIKTSPGFLYYGFKDSINYQVEVPADSFFNPITSYQKKEIFSGYIIISKQNGYIYADGELPMVSGKCPDTLAKAGALMFTGIMDLKMANEDYKLFYRPFSIGGEELYICGVVKTSAYNTRLNRVPVNFVYPLAIALLVILMLLPILKFFAMGQNEHVYYADFIMGTFSFFVGSAVLAIIIIQVLLLVSANFRAKENIDTITGQISKNFDTEVANAWKQLGTLDTMVDYGSKEQTSESVAPLLNDYFFNQKEKNNTHTYYEFDRVSWVDSTGQQKIKWDMESSNPIRTNVRDRKYFTLLQQNGGYPVPGNPGKKCGIEALNSLTNGGYNIVISRKGEYGGAYANNYTLTMATQMPSVVNTILPPGYGYCIIDETGEVMAHSVNERSLQENFIEKTSSPFFFREAITARQYSYSDDILFYGKKNAVGITPLGNLPFYVVCFYDRGYIMPVNLRILSFSAVFCLLGFSACVLVWLVLSGKKYSSNKALYEPFKHLKWVVPKERSMGFYKTSSSFLILYTVAQSLVLVFIKFYLISNFTVLLLTLLLPFNIFTGLVIVNGWVSKKYFTDKYNNRKNEYWKLLLFAFALQFAAAIALPFYFCTKGNNISIEIYIPAICLLYVVYFLIYKSASKLDAIISFLPGLLHKGLRKLHAGFIYKRRPKDYMHYYARFITSLVASLAVLPACVFTWYSYNHEIYQSIKKNQLYYASSLAKKSESKFQFYKTRLPQNNDDSLANLLLFNKGVFFINNDKVSHGRSGDDSSKANNVYDPFYFEIAKSISNKYYDPLRIPVLKDSAFDTAWYWASDKNHNALKLRYNILPPVPLTFQLNKAAENIPLEIVSKLPTRYKFIGTNQKGALMLLLVFIFLYGLLLLIKHIAQNLFLRKYIDGEINYGEETNTAIMQAFDKFEKKQWQSESYLRGGSLLKKEDIIKLQDEYQLYHYVKDSTKIFKQEKQLAASMGKHGEFYRYLWDKCSSDEKYLLLNYAGEGFANFKNSHLLISIINRGMLVVRSEELKFFSPSFRAFVLAQKKDAAMQELSKQFKDTSIWQTAKTILLVAALGVALFIFFTQEQTFQKLLALVGGIGTILTFLLRFFTDGGSLVSGKK